MIRYLIYLGCLVFLGGCSSPSKGGLSIFPSSNALSHPAACLRKQSSAPESIGRELDKRVAEPYLVEPGDVLLVQPASLESPVRLPGDQIVLPDGTIQLGRFGRLQVAGKTVEQIESEVNEQIRRAIPEAGHILVRLATRDSKVFYVLGEVNAPGAFPLRGRETVLDAILAAGGTNSCAARQKIILTRPTPPNSCRIVLPVDLVAIIQEGDTTTNYQIRAGDRIFVPAKSLWDELCAPFDRICEKPALCCGSYENQPTTYTAPTEPLKAPPTPAILQPVPQSTTPTLVPAR